MTLIKQHSFDQLIDNVYQIHCALQGSTIKVINQNLTIRNWLVGCYIVEYEQNGEDRAKYGAKLISELASKLKTKGLKGFSVSALKNHRTFYLLYPQISQSVIGLFEKGKSQSLIGELQITVKNAVSSISIEANKIWRTAVIESNDNLEIVPELLLSRLSYTHFIELIRIDNSLERLFYEVETIKNNWSVRELERAIETSLFVRTGLSKNKHAVIAKIKNLKPERNVDIIRNPYILEFLGLEEKSEYSESDLEEAILTNLQKFLIELGTGFCFEARQKRITFDNTHYRIDLVFYHRILKSHVLIDLKIGKFTHADAGQMMVYLNYFKDNEMLDGDNPPVGIILCGDKNDTLVKYASAGMDDQFFVSKYLVKLPEKKILEEFIRKELEQ